MKVVKTPIEGCLEIEFPKYKDLRGSFEETYHNKRFQDLGLPSYFVQDNLSYSNKNVLRGIHIQKNNPQGKLVRCLRGVIYDVCVDLRRNSPTYGRWHGVHLSHQGEGFYIPEGCGHGFLVIQGQAIVYYKCTTLYDPGSDTGIFYNDKEVGIHWPRLHYSPDFLISERDLKLSLLKDF